MGSRLFTGASVLSLLLCVLLLSLRIRAALTHDYISWAKNGKCLELWSAGDIIHVHEYDRWPVESLNWRHGTGLLLPTVVYFSTPSLSFVTVDPAFHPIPAPFPFSLGRHIIFWRLKGNRDVLSLSYTHWILYMSVLPLLELGFWICRRVQAVIRCNAGCCPACGYNLTGNTSGTCPECGTPAVPPHKATATA